MFLGGGVGEDLFGAIGLGRHRAPTSGGSPRWPLALVAAALALRDRLRVRARSTRRVPLASPAGRRSASLLWLVASAGFAVYLTNLANYGAATAPRGAVVVLLLWLFISANAFLLGAQSTPSSRSAVALDD